MKIKVSIPEEMHLHNEIMLARVVEVEIDDEQMQVLVQEVAAQLRLRILPAFEPQGQKRECKTIME